MSKLLALFCLFAFAGAQAFAVDDLIGAYNKILASDPSQVNDPCRFHRVAIFSDKPVYRNGETIFATVFMYNLVGKQPTRCKNPSLGALQLYDSQDKFIADFKDKGVAENLAQDFELAVASDLPGGSYKLKYTGQPGDEIRIFILKYEPKAYAVIGDWNLESVKIGDKLVGKISYKILSRATTPASATLRWAFSSQGVEVATGQGNLLNGAVTINFTVPAQFSQLLVFDATADIDGVKVTYKKEFFEPLYDKVIVDFVWGSGKPFSGQNKVYFRAFEDDTRKIETAISDAKVVRDVGGVVSTVVASVKSQFEGKGSFVLNISQKDVSEKATYYLVVNFDLGYNRQFVIANFAKVALSPVGMSSSAKVYRNSDRIRIDLVGNQQVLLVLQDKTKIYFQKIINLRGSFSQTIPNLTGVEYGGVFTVQCYTTGGKVSIRPVKEIGSQFDLATDQQRLLSARLTQVRPFPIRPPPPPPSDEFSYPGVIEQEFEIFIEPKERLGAIVTTTGTVSPGNEIDYLVRLDRTCEFCSKDNSETVFAHIDVVDASAFVEIEKSRVAPSLMTKVFLDREVYNKDREFFNAYQYIDHLFDGSPRNTGANLKLELLLGVQAFRKFLFDPNNLRKYVNNPWNQEYQEAKYAFEYLVPGTQQRFFPFDDFMFVRKNALPMQMNVAGGMPVPAPAAPQQERQPPKEDKSVPAGQALEQILKKDNILHRNFGQMRNGRIFGKFSLPKRSATFAIRVHLVSSRGVYGFVEKTFVSQKPFNIAADLPLNFYKDEQFVLPLVLENNQNVAVSVTLTDGKRFDIPAKGSVVHTIVLTPKGLPLDFQARDANGNVLDTLRISPALLNNGTLQTASASGYVFGNQPLNFSFYTPASYITGNNSLRVCFKNSGLGLIIEAIRKLNQQPYGCFEQASSVNFPLVLALKLLLKLRPFTPELQKLFDEILANLKKGIALLLTYECTDGGFEWFGKSPCHATLTAYGLWQFREIRDLGLDTPLFDYALLDRLVNFLQTAKDGKGGYKIRGGYDELGNPDQEVSDIYVNYVLSQDSASFKSGFASELQGIRTLYGEYKKNPNRLDSYRLALVALMYFNLGEVEVAREIVIQLFSRQKPSGEIAQSITSITRSSGISLSIETTALTLIIALRVKYFDNLPAIDGCLKYLTGQMTGGAYSSTQATILSLMAFSEYISAFNISANREVYNISFQGKQFGSLSISPNDLRPQCIDLSAALAKVEAPNFQIQVAVTATAGSQSKSFFSIDLQYYDSNPSSVYNSPLIAKVSRQDSSNNFVYNVQITNNKQEDVGMVTYEFNKPSCSDFNINDLDNMVKRQIIDYYEIRNENSQVAIYFRGMRKNSTREFTVSVVKRYTQTACKERIHLAYLYYDKDGSLLYVKV